MCILVSTLPVPLAPNPKLFPVGGAITVDGALATDSESVDAVGIHQGGEVLAGLPLDARLAYLEVTYAVGALQYPTLFYHQMGALAEEQTAAVECALRHYHHSAALLGGTVYHGLNGACLHLVSALAHAVVGQKVAFAQRGDIHLCRIAEPLSYGFTIGPVIFNYSFLLRVCIVCQYNHDQK